MSVIMPAYNSEAFIADAIRSVISQTYQNWELLIVNDASNDSTAQILQKFNSEENRIRVFNNSANKGTAYSRNKAIEAAEGQFISFLDADDLWKENKLKRQLEVLSKANVAACFSSYQ